MNSPEFWLFFFPVREYDPLDHGNVRVYCTIYWWCLRGNGNLFFEYLPFLSRFPLVGHDYYDFFHPDSWPSYAILPSFCPAFFSPAFFFWVVLFLPAFFYCSFPRPFRWKPLTLNLLKRRPPPLTVLLSPLSLFLCVSIPTFACCSIEVPFMHPLIPFSAFPVRNVTCLLGNLGTPSPFSFPPSLLFFFPSAFLTSSLSFFLCRENAPSFLCCHPS